ncbi:serine acetyltransferase [Rhodococcus sp. BP-349]|uniref:serine O-acetyltransferase n=1 Tax=unclassified Rhodococcus (in: high G+C Gram-positive bacteria) TaxID=192944 RepID=UPI001C9A7BD5|nr:MULTISPECIES: hypothetical protein [unclassified Rhodococcus (in: high G+C Gram-positive bacteria)]MBY6539474.1 serine acetyltransferase [Rhodococcus sp. BP-363]MBY6544198.1 serine acetyltransferase [Rhodococcus sp. BP-369]MBY6563428.1 serine acetyltransferase [Rhodococcus sp. BP-370]MBY6577720.1 serine acetyltransferase [Rhodococcus sp. BP-364]MBY6587021.1 serine acetyltransferase [Rhodococcus sp. BP-358]
MSPDRLWLLSCRLHERGHTRAARVVKTIIFLLFHAVLPYEARLGRDVQFWHRGLGVVVHPNSSIGDGARISQNVTLASGDWEIADEPTVVIGRGVMIGAGAFISSRKGRVLRIGDGARIGANAVVTDDVAAWTTVAGPKATVISSRPAEFD